MLRRLALALSSLSSLSLAACASSSPGSAVVDAGLADEDAAPSVPTCATVGQTICDAALQGYVSDDTTGLASAKSFAPTTLAKVLAAGTQKYALVYASAFWCSTCKQVGAEVVAQWPTLASKALFVDVLIEGDTPTSPTTKANLDAWIAGMKNAFTTVMDADPTTFAAKSTLGIRETSYVVERATGTILAKTTSPTDALAKLNALP